MTTRSALLVALMLVLPGVALRVVPYVERLTQPRVSRDAALPAAAATSSAGVADVSSRLSERPLALVIGGFAVEIGIYVVALVVLLRSRRLVALLLGGEAERRRDCASLAQLTARGALFVALVAGFLAGSQNTFPFVAWRMYSGIVEEPPTAYVVSGLTRGGTTVRVDLGQVLSMLGNYRGYNFLAQRAALAADGEGEGSGAELTTALRTVARLYNVQHPTDPLRRVAVSSMTIPLDDNRPPWVRDVRVIAAVDVE